MKFNFKKKYGQNFLKDETLLGSIVDDAKIDGKEVLEIGAGAGALTRFLDKRAKKVVSFEIDTELKPILEKLNLGHTTFIFDDALKISTQKIEDMFDENFCLVANLPYYITTPLIFKFLEETKKIDSLTIMVQKEVAERIVADPGKKDYGLLSVMVAFYGNAHITRYVLKDMFEPMPNVDSAVVHIDIDHKKFDGIDPKKFYTFAKTCFLMRRKTLQNNLAKSLKIPKEKINFGNIDPSCRSETLSIFELVDLFVKVEKFIK